VQVDVLEHVVAADEVLLDRCPALLDHHDRRPVVVGLHLPDEPVPIKAPVARPGVQGVAAQVVHAVAVERAGDEVGEESEAGIAQRTGQQLAHPIDQVGIDVGQQVGHRGPTPDELEGPLLVGLPRDRFKRMTEGAVADVVEEAGEGGGDEPLVLDPVAHGAQPGQGSLGSLEGAERVGKSRVSRAGVDVLGEPELADPPEALDFGRVDQRLDLDRRHSREQVEIDDPLHRALDLAGRHRRKPFALGR
jgi:hypothetical protein